ncbi:MAG: sulfur oxidation c-type cytochrome SoxA [Gammaproteobacteria bacterium]
MFKFLKIFSIICFANLYLFTISHAELEDPEHIKDLHLIQSYFKKQFPDVAFKDFSNGVYALDNSARENWEALEEFPPYEMHIDNGDEYWRSNNAIYSKCFPNGPAIKHLYPQWNDQLNTVVTVPYAINLCRQSHSLNKLDYMGLEMNSLVAYIAYKSRDKAIDISIPNQTALSAYQKGKKFYFTRRGQLNFACFHCHFDNAGKKLRTESLGPALGQTTGWPTYRNKWGALGPLHRRYIGCNQQVRAAPFEAQSETYRNLEYFHTHMNNGLPINGPAVRR